MIRITTRRYTTRRVSWFGRHREAVVDAHAGFVRPRFVAPHAYSLDEQGEKLAPSLVRLGGVLFEGAEADLEGGKPRRRVSRGAGVVLRLGLLREGRVYEHGQVARAVLQVEEVGVEFGVVQVPGGVEPDVAILLGVRGVQAPCRASCPAGCSTLPCRPA
jgi:hypothetical protein